MKRNVGNEKYVTKQVIKLVNYQKKTWLKYLEKMISRSSSF